MRTQIKLLGVAALMSGLSTAAIAQTTMTENVPASLESSKNYEAQNSGGTVQTYTESAPLAASEQGSMAPENGVTMTTEVGSSVDNGSVPASLADSRLAQADDLMQSDNANMMITPMTGEMIVWEGEQADEMRAAILSNTKVKDALAAEGYSEMDVVSAYTRADGGLTLVVEG